MAREKAEYRQILEGLLAFMNERGGGHLMGIKDVSEFLGLTPKTAIKRFALTKNGITVEAMASRLASL